MTDFFISYTGVDEPWAQWIASILEAAGYSTKIQAWDFRPGDNFVVEMHRAAAGSDRTIAVLSPDYLRSLYAMAEWAAAFAADPDGTKGKLVPVLVRKTDVDGLLTAITHIKLEGLGESAAREALLKGLTPGRARPESVRFPGARLFPGPAPSPPDPDAAKAALADLPLDKVPDPGPLPVGSRMPWAPNPLFVGREEDLRILAHQLKAGGTSAVGQVEIAAATGLGGMGKTQLASEFVHRYGRFFAGGVFWMSFADAGSVSVEVAACGQSLGLHLSFESLTLEQQVRMVKEAWQSPIPRLLVFDNCEEEELLRRWRPTSGGARVLVTSRRSEWDATLGVKTVPLTTLPRLVSIELLRRFRPDIPESEPTLDGIAANLGDLPLALHLAGSFLKKYRNADFALPATYLNALRKMDLLNHPSLQGQGSGISPTGHEGHVGRTFALSLQRLDSANATDALAMALLARTAWFAPGEPIPRSLLLETVHANSGDLTTDMLAEDALRRLMDLGLIEGNERNDLLMHRLVAAWARGDAEDDKAKLAVEGTILTEAKRLNETRNPALLLAYRPHLRAVTDQAMQREDKMAAWLCNEFGIHLWHAGDYTGARPYLEKAVAFHEKVSGPEHKDAADSLNALGVLFSYTRDFQRARPYLKQALTVRERVLGLEHPDTAKSLNDLGFFISTQGDPEGARSYHERALAIRERALGPEHPDTALSLSNLGFILYSKGDFKGADIYQKRALAIREKILGPEHPDTAASLDNLALLLHYQGDLAGAYLYHERALAIREKVLGPEHPNTANSLGNLGGILHNRGDLEGARRYYERALIIYEKVLEPEHPDIATSLNELGTLLLDQEDFEGARHYHERALMIREKVLGPEHPDTANSLNNLGALLQRQGDIKRAHPYYERAVAIFEKVLGPEHPNTAKCLLNLGLSLQEQGNAAKARWYLERALRIFNTHLGPSHPDTQKTRRSLSMLPGARQQKKQRSKRK